MLPEEDLLNQPADRVARRLLGSMLCCRQVEGAVVRWPITEVEAYLGPEDRACHAAAGRTGRTEVMYGPPGYWYVYLCYGVHWLANLVTGPPGHPAAVLLRGAGPVAGPGRLTKALGVNRSHGLLPAIEASGFWIELEGALPDAAIRATPRIGVDYAGAEWATKPLRFVWEQEWAGRRGKKA